MFLKNMFASKKPNKDFVEWCNGTYKTPQGKITASDVMRESTKSDEGERGAYFIESINYRLDNIENIFNISINQPLKLGKANLYGDKTSFTKYIGSLTIERHVRNLNIHNCYIRDITISLSDTANNLNLNFNNCHIRKISVRKTSNQHGSVGLNFSDTKIGVLDITGNSIKLLEVDKGCILDIICPPPGKDNPFIGNVSIKDVFFPTDTKNYLLTGAQPYRNLRHHLLSMENSQMANLFHGHELKVERESDTLTNNFISGAYYLFSNYGSSVLRPILLLIFVAAITVIWSYNIDGAVLTLPVKYYTGWREALVTLNSEGNWHRSFLLSAQSIINPVSVFGVKQLVVAKTGSLATWVFFQSLFSIIFIALSIFAIRRRFKIK